MTIGVSAFMLFIMLRYSSYVAHQETERKKKKKKEKKALPTESQPPLAVAKPAVSMDEPLGGELLSTEGGVSLA